MTTSWAEQVAAVVRDTASSLDNVYELGKHQHIPAHGFGTHILLAGRGAGKTFAAMHWLNQRCWDEPGLRARVIAPTLGDGVASCVEGVDGLLPLSGNKAKFNPSAAGGAVVTYPNGSKVWIVGTPTPKDVDRLRALTNMEIDVFEEAAANPQLAAAVAQASLSRRRGEPRCVVTTTPRPLPTVKKWVKDAKEGKKVTVIRGSMADNPNLPEAYREYAESLEGTRLYQQEVLGEILEDVEGALWLFDDIKRSGIDVVPELERIAIGVDPAVGAGTTGIVVVGIAEGILYVLDDLSMTDVQPSKWAAEVGKAYLEWSEAAPTVIVAEDNQGGRLVGETLQAAQLTMPIKMVTSRVSKEARATPIALLWEVPEQRARMIEGSKLTKLRSQMLEWVPGEFSPDRIDAMVHGGTYLRGKAHGLVEIQHGAPAPVINLTNFRQGRIRGA